MEERIASLEVSITNLTNELKALKDSIGSGFGKVEGNFEVISQKIDDLGGSTDKNFKGVNSQLQTLQEEISKIGTVTQYGEQYNNLTAIR